MLTPDKRYIVVRGRLWRAANAQLSKRRRQELTRELMAARRSIAQAKRRNDSAALANARSRVNAAKVALGERGPVWWSDGSPDLTRHLVKNTPYGAWYAAVKEQSSVGRRRPAREGP